MSTETTRRPPERLLDLAQVGLGEGLAIWKVHVDDLHEQPLNAQAMTKAAFGRLKETVERDRRLESFPLGALLCADPVRIDIVSGHHRVRASRAAGVFYVGVLVDETGLSPDAIKAKQLAHNAIVGESEPQLLARIFASIRDVDLQREAFVQPELAPLAPVRLPRLELDLAYRTVQLVFLSSQADRFDAGVAQLAEDQALADGASKLYLVDLDLFDRWAAWCRRLGKEHAARSVTVQAARMLDACQAQYGLAGGEVDPDDWVPLADLLGSALVPPDAAGVIRECVEAMTRARGGPARGWEAVRDLAEAWLDKGLSNPATT
jgi:ParB-like chromosome segregation protein Spo0J